jgi:hypothetical protein
MADLAVNLTLLETTSGSLGMLMHEFNDASDIADSYAADVGSGTLNDALHNFATNWKSHRESLVKAMDGVYKLATQGHDTYIQADDKLAQDLVNSQKGGHQ